MKTDLPRTIYLKDYTPPPYLISNTELDVALTPSQTTVKARLSLRPNPNAKGKAQPLKLDGELLELVRVTLDGQELPASKYVLTDKDLTINDCAVRALHARNRDDLQSRSEQGAVRALPLARRLLHAMRGGRLPAHHLLPRPAGRLVEVPRAHRGGHEGSAGPAVEWQPHRKRRSRQASVTSRSGKTRSRSRPISSRWSRESSAWCRTASRRARSARSICGSMSSRARKTAAAGRWNRSSAPWSGTKSASASNTTSTPS